MSNNNNNAQLMITSLEIFRFFFFWDLVFMIFLCFKLKCFFFLKAKMDACSSNWRHFAARHSSSKESPSPKFKWQICACSMSPSYCCSQFSTEWRLFICSCGEPFLHKTFVWVSLFFCGNLIFLKEHTLIT